MGVFGTYLSGTFVLIFCVYVCGLCVWSLVSNDILVSVLVIKGALRVYWSKFSTVNSVVRLRVVATACFIFHINNKRERTNLRTMPLGSI